jgi:hypothetical protein
MSTETPRLVPIIAGRVCIGHLISLGPRGVEAFDTNERTLGVFQSPIDAANAVTHAAGPINGETS